MMVRVFLGAEPPYGVIQGVRTGRSLSILARAIMAWFACGWYQRVIVDLSSFHDWSPEAVDLLARAVITARADAMPPAVTATARSQADQCRGRCTGRP